MKAYIWESQVTPTSYSSVTSEESAMSEKFKSHSVSPLVFHGSVRDRSRSLSLSSILLFISSSSCICCWINVRKMSKATSYIRAHIRASPITGCHEECWCGWKRNCCTVYIWGFDTNPDAKRYNMSFKQTSSQEILWWWCERENKK